MEDDVGLVGVFALDVRSIDGHRLDVAFIHLMHELGEVQGLVFFPNDWRGELSTAELQNR